MQQQDTFSQLLAAARAQPQPQRLLFVFTQRELPADASDSQRQAFAQSAGGALQPIACVDKSPHELSDFAALVAESRQACPPWDVVFIAALSGAGTQPPAAAQVSEGLKRMVAAVQSGHVGPFLALNAEGDPLTLAA